MNDDLRAAAKRLQRYKAGDETAYPDDREYFDERGCTLLESDETKLADFAAAELDDSPLTPELLRGMLGPFDRFPSWRLGNVDIVHCINGAVIYAPGSQMWNCKTVGDLRTVLRLAGVPVKGKNNG